MDHVLSISTSSPPTAAASRPPTSGPVRDTRPAVSPTGGRLVFRRQLEDEPVQPTVTQIDSNDPTQPLAKPAPPIVLEGVVGEPQDPSWTSEGQAMYTVDGTAWVVDVAVDAVPTSCRRQPPTVTPRCSSAHRPGRVGLRRLLS